MASAGLARLKVSYTAAITVDGLGFFCPFDSLHCTPNPMMPFFGGGGGYPGLFGGGGLPRPIWGGGGLTPAYLGGGENQKNMLGTRLGQWKSCMRAKL